jgi:uncharacterized DUF497 family protein
VWDNQGWAAQHIHKKHRDVSLADAWEVAFEMGYTIMVSPDQLHYPPYRRYWIVGKARNGKRLLVAWEQWKELRNLITAYQPNERQVKAYEDQSKKSSRKR